MKLIEQIETTTLDDLCNSLTQEIVQLSSAKNKLKFVFVLVHIIDESQKALSRLETNNFVKELRELVDKACQETEKQKEVQKLRFDQDKELRNIIDGSNSELLALDREIAPLLARYEEILNSLVKIREQLPLEKQMELEKK